MKITIIFSLVFILIMSCDVVDQVPVSELTGKNFWQNESDAEAGLVATYDLLQGLAAQRLIYLGDVRADNLEVPSDLGWNVENPTTRDMKENIFSPTDGQANWNSFFTGIARANNVLANVPNMEFANQADQNRIMGEAYFLRAYFYFVLVRNWGDVPIILEPYTSVTGEMYVGRDPEEQVYDQIIMDAEQAEQLLPIQHENEMKTRIRSTKGSAQALLTNVLLERGYKSFAASDDFQRAAEKAQEVINSGLYTLVSGDTYATIFTEGLSNESILEMYYDNAQNELNQLSFTFFPRAFTKSRPYGGDFVLMPSRKITDEYESGDLRAGINFNYTPNPTEFYDEAFAGAPYVAKYPGTVIEEGALRVGDSNFILYRLSDVILMRAEALVQSNNVGAAIALLNQIRNRAGLPNTTASSSEDVARAIQEERFYELCFEGKRWYDLVRTGLVNEVLPDHGERMLLPVPQNDIDLNPSLLPQNPTY